MSADLRATLAVETGQHAGKTVVLDGRPVGIGRSSKCALSLKGAPGVSRDHALLMVKDGLWMLTDAGSRNGTLLNGAEVQGSVPLNDGDVIGISEERVRFSWPARAAAFSSREAPMPSMASGTRSIPPLPGASSMVPTMPPVSTASNVPTNVTSSGPQKKRDVPRTTRTIRETSSALRPAAAAPHAPTIPFVDVGHSLPETVPPPSPISNEGPTAAHQPAPSGASGGSASNRRSPTLPRTLPPRKKSSALTFVLGGFAGLLLAALGGLAFDHVKDGGTRRATALAWAEETFTTLKARYVDGMNDEATAFVVDAGPVADGGAPAAARERADAGTPLSGDAGVNARAPVVDAGPRERVTGTVAEAAPAPVKVPVKAPLAGRIADLRVKPGDTVTVDTTVAIVESGSAKIMKKLVPLDKKARALRDSAARGKKSAKKELKSVENSIAKLSKKLKKTTVKAGVTGTVDTVHVDEGTHLKGKDALVTIVEKTVQKK